MALKFLKWVEIIKAESEAVKRNAMYVLQKDAETCDVIFIDSKGRKRKASGLTLPQIEKQLARIDATNIDATAQVQWRSVLNLYTKAEVDDIAEGLSQALTTSVESYIEITKSQLDTHITNSTLKPGVLYGIKETERWMLLGDSTDTLFLRAVSTNQLETKGTGKFFVPKYDQYIDGYGIWKGEVYGAFPTTVPTPVYAINDKVIWGGRLWKNVTGNLGTKVNIYTLSSDWEVIPFNETDYNVRFDKIEYDYKNDMVIYRKDDNGNEISTSYEDWYRNEKVSFGGNPLNISLLNSLKIYQWGNEYNNDTLKGCGSNIIINSTLECLNTFGTILYNTLENYSQISSNTLENNGQIGSNTLNNGQINSNTLNNGQINSNTLNNGQISSNTLENYSQIRFNTLENNGQIFSNTLVNNGQIGANTLNNGQIGSNTLNNGQINSNTLENYSQINFNNINNVQINSNTLENYSQISFNDINNVQISFNTLENYSQINFNTLENYSQISSNTLENNGQIRLGLTNTINNKRIQYLTINGGDIGGDAGINLSSATLVYADFTREVFKNSAGVTKIKYFNENYVMVIADLTD